MMQCAICYRKADNEYCLLHDAAFVNIVQAYQKWNSSKAIGWLDYLRGIMDNPNSGLWVVEVCRYLLSGEQAKTG